MSYQIPDRYFISQEECNRVESLNFSVATSLRIILDGFKWAVRSKNTSAVIIIDGRSGMGKSTLAFQVGKYCDKDFGLDNVYFTPEEFLKGLSTARPGTVHIFDEAMLLSSRGAMTLINRAAIQAMSMIRSKKIIVIFCVNSIFDLDRNLALSRADLLLSVYGDSLTDRGKFMAFFKIAGGEDRLKQLYLYGKKYYDYSKPHSNFNTTFSSRFILDEVEYEKRKQEGVNRFLSGKETSYTQKSLMKQRDSFAIWIRENSDLTEKEIGEIAGMPQQTISRILKSNQNQESTLLPVPSAANLE